MTSTSQSSSAHPQTGQRGVRIYRNHAKSTLHRPIIAKPKLKEQENLKRKRKTHPVARSNGFQSANSRDLGARGIQARVGGQAGQIAIMGVIMSSANLLL